jgi:hypothetical protein
VDILGLATLEWFFSYLVFHLVNKKSFVICFMHCYFVNTLCTHLLYIRSQFLFFKVFEEIRDGETGLVSFSGYIMLTKSLPC